MAYPARKATERSAAYTAQETRKEHSSSSDRADEEETEMPHRIPMTRRDFIRAHAILGGTLLGGTSVGRLGWRLAEAQPRAPIIDMHLHAFPADFFGKRGLPNPVTGTPSAASTDEALLQASLTALERYNIVKAVTSGPRTRRTVAGCRPEPFHRCPPVSAICAHARSGNLDRSSWRDALGRWASTAQYADLSPSDPSLEPYFALAEELDLPVGMHTGLGPPGTPMAAVPKFRVAA